MQYCITIVWDSFSVSFSSATLDYCWYLTVCHMSYVPPGETTQDPTLIGYGVLLDKQPSRGDHPTVDRLLCLAWQMAIQGRPP